MLEVRNLHSFYGDAHVLHGVSLEVKAGEVVALLGRNGMGKTTLIRSIMRLAQPQMREGSLLWKGEELKHLTPHEVAKKRIALVPQGRRLFPSLTVVEHLTMLKPASAKHGWTVNRVLEMFPRLAERKNHRGNQLSGGERQMLAVGRSLMIDPELVLMDEPSEGLAPVMVQHLETIIADLGKTGLAILLVEQNLYSALSVASRIYVLETGKVVHAASVEEVKKDQAPLMRFLGVH
ncbi:ABC transporter ATP-binding protein [Pseudaminobacter arsenicus]|uniref:ABC transporter ATP-binding protein n=1 Tax=Borborobacter arsenicus TaxID=1851146 RepID=A0A432V3G6_9HYPH|nr:ABC transporter ATP-binding protein [Pseudaminobacter arsenicus]RUM96696.1 ABC transporter ATP-binding protein [Pseudaminobacter arsenicus]